MSRSLMLIVASTVTFIGCSRSEEARPVAAATADTAGGETQLSALVGMASEAEEAGDTAGALVYLRDAVSLDSGSAPLVRRLARTSERVGDTATAARAYRRYIALTPSGSDADSARQRLAELAPETQPRVAAGTVEPEAPAAANPTSAPVATRSARPRADEPLRGRRPAAPVVAAGADRGEFLVTEPVRGVLRGGEAGYARPGDSAVVVGLIGDTVVTYRPGMTEAPTPPHPIGRWSRMERWVVAKFAALGVGAGVAVGALVGNVPGAVLAGVTTGSGVGFARVRKADRDSVRRAADSVRVVARALPLGRAADTAADSARMPIQH